MKLLVVYLVFFSLLNVPCSFAEDQMPIEVTRFLDSRKLVSIIYFDQGSLVLSSSAMKSIDSAAPRLRRLDMKKVVVRFEGFAPNEGDDEITIPLSMHRALAVMTYMREKCHIETDFFIIGCGDRDLSEVPVDKRRRVEIALYKNYWDIENAPVGDLILNW